MKTPETKSSTLPAIRKTAGYSDAHHKRMRHAYAMSTEVAAEVARHVFAAAMIDNQPPELSRWEVGLTRDPIKDTYDKPSVLKIDDKALVITLKELARQIDVGNFAFRDEDIAALNIVTSKCLARRLEWHSKNVRNAAKPFEPITVVEDDDDLGESP
jgi:hypothetical protein